ncbi:MAG: hypothetical protein UT32_C0011G0024 [Parcubacteria group bacterium GW2011_GWC2_39_14]|nr:MAG: hypothetical protein UT32_C0011G0024 [Parcubacteria group bacterium GW2011_GWC2_39_14]KKR55060.1 MAG: hypothetical protein UT91_C0005G0061 [Parcubacteria group bacterium GW2011_GWA2_40_23]
MAAEVTDAKCVVCGGPIVREITRTPVGAPIYGGKRPTELGPTQNYCQDCGLMYHHLPENRLKKRLQELPDGDDHTPPRRAA